MDLTFSPPLHKQRRQFVVDFVKRNKPKKVVDLGCGECTLLKMLKFHHEIELLVGVDVNGAKVKKRMHGLAPISTDYLEPSYDQLCVELYQGSVTQKDARLKGFDLVTSIELIEHLTPADVELFSEVVFGYMTPKMVIISTPNSEFNIFMPGVSCYRHSDHKFEWTRAEFRSWAVKVCLDYGYEVEFTGVGKAPQGQQEAVGFCTQIGVFYQLGGRDCCKTLLVNDAEDLFSYTLLYRVNYPSLCDNNILRRVLVSEVLYGAEKLKNRWMEEQAGGICDAVALCQTEGAACAEEMKDLMEWSGASDSAEKQGSCTSCRIVAVPLDVLWSCCPKVSVLSGSLGNLKHLLMDEPNIKLSQDSSAVLVNHWEQDQEEKEDDYNLDDSGYPEASLHSHSVEQEEDWEEND
ncbi:small RNA 2'-O-methyltransferase isoform X1 [Neolamprologus brichardi]|uniref:small RNA 2'-O-methyltransferase isoform X1 n=2 Tax=Neolamprologus brichardi TaxID=32507 RepID=UPI0003EC5722|nr:small RNA 2'-O-methyltransferase isoform X1 [Neolamprologus brichardi]